MCPTVFQPDHPKGGRKAYCSDECRQEALRIASRKGKLRRGETKTSLDVDRVCVVCGSKYKPKASNQKCCSPKCARIRDKENQVKSRRRRMGVTQPMDQDRICEVCQEPFKPTAGAQKRCKDCIKTYKYPRDYKKISDDFEYRLDLDTPNKICTLCKERPVMKGNYFLCEQCFRFGANTFCEDCLYADGGENLFEEFDSTLI